MAESKQGFMTLEILAKAGALLGPSQQNPIAFVQTQFKEVEARLKVWLAKQSLVVEASVLAGISVAQGAAIGAFMGTLTSYAAPLITPPLKAANFNPEAMASLKQAQVLAGGLLVQAHNFAVMTGVNDGISCVMKRLGGKEDVQ
ncbi:hypothetical protein PHJA_000556500 [Phtheirospermum japonicum]|uniref:Uncharacterized protein n=1 Tax=Phtheirospermum japonicum TaxID=374723 RepID=A0A830BG70_9LAMI|nr:hypothetical protein PHJA_000556500 [Phtheirospermum japonicum]